MFDAIRGASQNPAVQQTASQAAQFADDAAQRIGSTGSVDRLVQEAQAAGSNLPERIYALGQSVGSLRMGAESAINALQHGITRLGGEFGKQVIDGTTYLVGPQARNGIYNAFRVLSDGQVDRVRMQIVDGVMKVVN